jgi:hypothetical protein
MSNCHPGRRLGSRQPWPRRARAAALIAVMAVAAPLTACGGPSSPSSGASPNAGAATSTVSALSFARCVRAHGVSNFPDPDSSGTFSEQVLSQLGVSQSRLRAAMAPCGNLDFSGQGTISTQDQQDYLRAAACMRSHGITNFPDPIFSNGNVSYPTPTPLDTGSTQYIQAAQTCTKLIPAGLPHGSKG